MLDIETLKQRYSDSTLAIKSALKELKNCLNNVISMKKVTSL